MSKPDHAILTAVMSAKTLADLLGGDASDANVRKLRVQIHPDRFGGDDSAWRKLDELVAAARGPVVLPRPEFTPLELRAGKTTYRLESVLAHGGVADLYATMHAGTAAVAKVAGDPRDNDLLAAEAAALRVVRAKPRTSPGLDHLLPSLLDTFEVRSGGARRRVNIISRASTMKASPDPAYVTLAQVRAAYPDGLDFRDAAWIIRRMLAAIGLAHSRGYVHGAVLPHHMLVHPTEHDALLVDWCYAVPTGSKGRAVVAAHRDAYPPEYLAKDLLDPQADIYMLGRCAAYLLARAGFETHADAWAHDGIPRAVIAFVRGMLIANPRRRSADAWELHETFGNVLEDVVGPPRFRVLAMPPAAP